MPYDPTALVNQSQPESTGVYDLWGSMTGLTNQYEPVVAPPPPKPPATWGGEFTSAFGRGIDELEQMGYGGGALASSWLGADGMKDWFMSGYNAKTQLIEQNPETVQHIGDIDGFDKAIRYFMAQIGSAAPMVLQSAASSIIGGLAGTAAEPGGGTVAGGITGLVARKAVSELLKDAVKSTVSEGMEKELGEYLEGRVALSALSKPAQAAITKESLVVGKDWGVKSMVGVVNATNMTGAFYGEMENDPNIPESDKRVAATVGGFLASLPMTGMMTYIAKAFNPGIAEEALKTAAGKAMSAEQAGYTSRFLITGGKELFKNAGEGGAAMFLQSAINLAAKNWADPNTRWNFLSYSPAQWQEMIDSAGAGAVGIGVLGAGLGTIAHYPDPAVRSAIRDIQTRAKDVEIKHPEVTPDHVELSNVQNRIGELEGAINSGTANDEELVDLHGELATHQAREAELKQKLGMGEPPEESSGESLVNQNPPPKPPETTPEEQQNQAPPPPSPEQKKIDDLRAFYAQEMPLQRGSETPVDVPEKAVADKQAEINAHIDTVAGGTEYGENLKKAITPDLVRMMAGGDISIETATGEKKPFTATMDNRGQIHLSVPDAEAMKNEHGALGVSSEDYGRITNQTVAHEMVHAADLMKLRDEWNAGDKSKPLVEFVNQRYAERGANFRAADPELPKTAFHAYKGKIGEMSDIQLGQELPRMAAEMARSGTLTESTQALAVAASKNNKLDAFFRDWIDAIKGVGQTLRKWLDPQTTNPELLKAYDGINQMLDKYGALVNQPEAEPLVNQKPEAEPASVPEVKSPRQAELDQLEAKQKEQRAFVERNYPEPKPSVLPAQHVAEPPAPKEANYYQKFRQTIREKGPSDQVRSYLDWQGSKNNLPITKAETRAAHLDFTQRAQNTPMSLDRFRSLVNERRQNEEARRKESASNRTEPAQKATFANDVPEESGEHDESVSGNSGSTGGYHTRIAQAVAEARQQAPAGNGLEAIRQHVAEKHPYLSGHLDNIIKEVQSQAINAKNPDIGARWTAQSVPVRGGEVADHIKQYQYAMILPGIAREASVELGKERGIVVVGNNSESLPDDHYVISTDPVYTSEVDPLVNEKASIHSPVQVTDKLKEAQLTSGIPETHPIHAFGVEDMSPELLKAFDDHFGENQWILKSFSDYAMQSLGVARAKALKTFAETEPDTFRNTDTSHLMVQQLHDVAAPEDATSNQKILSGKELRVHVITDMDGNPHILPFATFWKLTTEEAQATPASRLTPIMVEDQDIQAAHQRALESIGSLPDSDRSGQFYGLDIIRTNDGGWGTVELNPSDGVGVSASFADSALAHESYMAALMGERPVHAELANEIHQAVLSDSEPMIRQVSESLVNESPDRSIPAEKPTFGKDTQVKLDNLEKSTQDEFERVTYDAHNPKGARFRERGGLGQYDSVTPQSMEYKVQTKTEAMTRASDAIGQEGGAIQMAERLRNNPLDPEIIAKVAGPDEVGQPVNAGIIAVYENSRRQLAGMIGSGALPRKAQTYLERLFHVLGTVRETLTALGRATSMSHAVDAIMNGATARQSYVEPFMDKMASVFGYKKGAQLFGPMREALESIKRDAMNRVISTPEMIAAFGELSKKIFTKEGQRAVRQTYVMTEQDARRAVKTMAARAAEHVANDEENPQWAREATNRLVKMMSGVPASGDGTTEQRLFINAATQIASEAGRKFDMVGETLKGPSTEDKIAAVMKNPELYSQFTDLLRRRMLEEYKPEPGSPFAQRMDDFHQYMRERQWSQGMVESLVNKNLKEYETTFAKIAKLRFGETDFNADKMREDVREAMLDRGVDNDGLVGKLMDDVEGDFRSRVEQARLDFMGSSTGVNKFLLEKAQGTLLELAKTHSEAINDRGEKLNEWLRQDYLIPDTPEMPIASLLHDVMTSKLEEMIGDKRKAVIQDMLERAVKNPEQKTKALQQVDRVLQLVNLGVMGDQAAYEGLAKPFGLPEYSEETAQKMREYGDAIATAPNEVTREDVKQEMSNFLLSQKGTLPYDMVKAMLYTNMLSGPSTLGVHVSSNFASTIGARVVDMVQHPKTIPQQLRQIFVAATNSALTEAQNTLIIGNRLYRMGDKFYGENNPLEHKSVVFASDLVNQRAREFSEKGASLLHKVYRRLGAQYIGRYLSAADAFFYKINQEAAFTAKTGWVETPEARGTAMDIARDQMRQNGESPDDGYQARLKQSRIANRILEDMRMESSPDAQEALLSAHNEALDATFKQKPKGILGTFANALESWANGSDKSPNLIGKMLVPFTRIAANVTNQMLEWTPVGLGRWAMGGDDFLLKTANGEAIGRDPKILIRSLMGMGGMMALYGMAAQYHDDNDPWFAIYDNGSKNPEKRRQMMDMGWRPKTFKIGRGYYSYVTAPFAMAFSLLGRIFDNARDGRSDENGLASSAVAMLQSVTHESFISNLTNFMSSVDSPNPEQKISQMLAQMATTPILPNLVKQVDKWVDPSIQQAQGFRENFIKQFPVVRHELKPSLNVFAQPLMHAPAIPLPGMERFLTMEKTDDPVLNLASEKNLTIPGFSKSAKLGDQTMTRDQLYQYVENAGPKMHEAIQAEIPLLRRMDREKAQDRVDEIVREVKKGVRDKMRSGR